MNQTVQQPTQAPATPAPAVSTPEAVKPSEVTAENIIQRSSARPPVSQTPANAEAPRVTVSMDDIKDPIARQIIEKKLHEANAGIAKTFGEMGADKLKYVKEAETLRKQLESSTNQSWTPQRVQELLNRPDFVQAAQTLQTTVAPQGWQGSTEEWSALNSNEKAQFQGVLNSQRALESQMGQMLQSQIDATLRTKYPDYSSKEVDDFIREAQGGSVSPDRIREAVHLALNAPRYIKQAYDFALQDKTATITEKLNGATQLGLNVTPSQAPVAKNTGERSGSHFSRMAWQNLLNLKGAPQK